MTAIILNDLENFIEAYDEIDSSIKPAISVAAILYNKTEIIQYLPKPNINDLITISIVFNKPDIFVILTDGIYTDSHYLLAMTYGKTDIIDTIYKSAYPINISVIKKFVTMFNYKIITRVIDHIYTKQYMEFTDDVCSVLVDHILFDPLYPINIVPYCKNYKNMEKLASAAFIECNITMLKYALANGVCMTHLGKIMYLSPPICGQKLDLIQLLILNGLHLTKIQICNIICRIRIYEDCIKFLKIMLDHTISETIYIHEIYGTIYTQLQQEHIYLIDTLFKIDYDKQFRYIIRSVALFHWLIDNNYNFINYFNHLANIIAAYDYIDMYGIEFKFNHSIYSIGRAEFYRLLDYMKTNNIYPDNSLPMLVNNYVNNIEPDDDNTYNKIIAAYDIFDNFDNELVKRQFTDQSDSIFIMITYNLIKFGSGILEVLDLYFLDYAFAQLIRSVVDNDYDKFVTLVDNIIFQQIILELCSHFGRDKFSEYIIGNYEINCDISRFMNINEITNINNLLLNAHSIVDVEPVVRYLCESYPEYITPEMIIDKFRIQC